LFAFIKKLSVVIAVEMPRMTEKGKERKTEEHFLVVKWSLERSKTGYRCKLVERGGIVI